MYLYDNMDTTTKFNETELPPKEEFYSKLNDSDISHEDYKNVKKVWKEFKMKTMGDYHDLYLKTDVLLLANMFEETVVISLTLLGISPLLDWLGMLP